MFQVWTCFLLPPFIPMKTRQMKCFVKLFSWLRFRPILTDCFLEVAQFLVSNYNLKMAQFLTSNYNGIQVELNSESDLLFNYEAILDIKTFCHNLVNNYSKGLFQWEAFIHGPKKVFCVHRIPTFINICNANLIYFEEINDLV